MYKRQLPRRFYPQGNLMCHVLGFVDFDGIGGAGVEGYYQGELAGEAASATVPISPLQRQTTVIAREGADLTLTCLLYTSDAADERSSVDLGGRRINKKKKRPTNQNRRPN